MKSSRSWARSWNPSTGAVNNKVASGSYKLAFGLDYTTRALIAEGSPCSTRIPPTWTPWRPPSVFLWAPPTQSWRQLLYDFILDPQAGQKILSEYYTTPVASGVELPEGMLDSTYIAQNAMPIDFEDLSAKSTEIIDKFDEIFKK